MKYGENPAFNFVMQFDQKVDEMTRQAKENG
jgi:hypothetical protein